MKEQNLMKCFSSSFGKVKMKFVDDDEIAMIKSLKDYLKNADEIDHDVWNDESQDSDIFKRAASRSQSRIKCIPNFNRKLFNYPKWPRSWFIRLSAGNY